MSFYFYKYKTNRLHKLIFCCALCCVYAKGINAQKITKIDGSSISADSLTADIKKLLLAANVSGAGVAVFNNFQPVYLKTFGYADVQRKKAFTPGSVFYAASLAKVVFGYIVLKLVDENKINLDTPLVHYLAYPLVNYKIKGYKRGYQDLQNDERYKKITARMCLDHTTGFPNWRWLEKDRKLKIKFDPGSRFSYSGEGLYLLQFVISQITGKGLEDLSREHVFSPFKMNMTSEVWQEKFDSIAAYGHNTAGEPYELMKWDEASAGGSMSTTLTDYAKFYTAFIQGIGLSGSAFSEMLKPQVRIRSLHQFGPGATVDSTTNDGIKLSYGLSVGLMETAFGKAFFKEGHDDGWGHYSVCSRDKGIAMIIITNNDNGESIFRELLDVAIGDRFTPWEWEYYIPYNLKK